MASKIIVRVQFHVRLSRLDLLTPGFVYRHTACGLPSHGLYANYDLGIELGKGSFASVKKAIHKQTGTWYAVKMISAAKTVRQSGSSRHATFAREISIMEKLEHRNICKLVEVFFHDDNSISEVFGILTRCIRGFSNSLQI